MGIIQKQAIRGTVFSYIGVLLGFVTTALLYPFILSTDEIGLLKLLVSFSVIFSQFGSLGFNSVINRLFPYFRDKSNNHNGFIFLGLLVSISGFLVTFGGFELLKPLIIRNNIENSALLVDYINYVLPLILVIIIFNLFDSYNKVLFDAVFGTFLKEFVQRFLILVSILLYYYSLVSFRQFVTLYIISFAVPTLIIFFVLIRRRAITFRVNRNKFTAPLRREIISLSLFGLISGVGTIAILHIDSIMVNKFMGLSLTGIYATTFFFGTLVIIPARSLTKISTAVIAESWKNQDMDNIDLIYKKSCVNQSVVSLLIFFGLWLNIDNIFQILPSEFEAGKWVIFFIGLGNVIEMSSGVNGIIILTSKYYRVHTYFIAAFVVMIILFNYIFIPLLGLTGAALASALSNVLFNLMRYLFLKLKFKLEPFNIRFPLIIVLSLMAYYIARLIPVFDEYLFDILIRSSVFVIIFVSAIYLLKVSEDINEVIKTVFSQLAKTLGKSSK